MIERPVLGLFFLGRFEDGYGWVWLGMMGRQKCKTPLETLPHTDFYISAYPSYPSYPPSTTPSNNTIQYPPNNTMTKHIIQ